MNQLNTETFYRSTISICNRMRANGQLINIRDRFFSFITEIVIEVDRLIKQSSQIDIVNSYKPLDISKICREKLKDFDLDPRRFDNETKRFYKAIIAGFRRQYDRFSRDYKDNYRTKRLKTNKDRFRYYFVEMVLYHNAVILDGTWRYYGAAYIDIWKGDVGRLVGHYLQNRYIERHKLGNFHRVCHAVESALYDIRDTDRGYCWRLSS